MYALIIIFMFIPGEHLTSPRCRRFMCRAGTRGGKCGVEAPPTTRPLPLPLPEGSTRGSLTKPSVVTTPWTVVAAETDVDDNNNVDGATKRRIA